MQQLNNTNAPATPVQGNAPATAPTLPATPASAPSAPATPATPTPTAAKPAPTPTVGKGATFTGINGPKGAPITAQQVFAWVNKAAGGNKSLVQVVYLGKANSANPMPFSNTSKGGKRASILLAMVNGVPQGKGKPNSRTLAAYLAYSGGIGASQSNPLDLLAALNGGFSTKASSWGTPQVKLVVTG